MDFRLLAASLLIPAATLLSGCAASVYDDRPVGYGYGYYEQPAYYERVPRYYHGPEYRRPVFRNDFDHGRPAAIRGGETHRVEPRAASPRGGFIENNHHESPHIEGGPRGEIGDGHR